MVLHGSSLVHSNLLAPPAQRITCHSEAGGAVQLHTRSTGKQVQSERDMGGKPFTGGGVGFGFGVGCGFGIGWGFGGGPIGIAGMGAGGGCGVGFGLGWGYGAAFGSKYIVIDPEFSPQDRRPRWLRQLQDQVSMMKLDKLERQQGQQQ